MPTLRFSVYSGASVSDAQWHQAADLFSRSYGVYSLSAPDGKAGRSIRLGAGYYRRAYANDEYKVAFCFDGDQLIGQIVYCECATSCGKVAFVVQLVVDADYRRKGVASTLLHAVWGFSDFYAWGIVTSNAFTVEALESATFRRADPKRIAEHADWIRGEVLSRIPFLRDAEWRMSATESCVNTNFFTDRTNATQATLDISNRLGKLAEGEEWLAMTFREQPPDDFSSYYAMVEASSDLVADAYSRMPQSEHQLAANADEEVSAILGWLPQLPKDASICDFGAGSGRHIAAFRKRGYENMTGIDFASAAQDVLAADCRSWRAPRPFDLILCLYDVIGSFPSDDDNKAILDNIVANLRPGGHAVISVSNFAYAPLKDAQRVDLKDSSDSLPKIFALPPSDTMQRSGEFFDPHYVLVDETRHIVCHKEQFHGTPGALPGEYLIRDRRFTASEISEWATASGLKVLERHFVHAGFSKEYPEQQAKEILLVTRLEKSQSPIDVLINGPKLDEGLKTLPRQPAS